MTDANPIPLASARRAEEKLAKSQVADARPRSFANPDAKLPLLGLIDPLHWQDKPVPVRRWLVDGLVPYHNVTMLGGDGGMGKSLAALQLLTAAAVGRNWLGVPTEPVKCLGVFCEDDADELHRRMESVVAHYDMAFGDLEHLNLLSRAGMENTMMEFEKYTEKGETTPFFIQVMNHAIDFGAQLVIIDSLHDVFAGNENSRPQARQFINGLREIATEIDGAVLLTAHPSLSGLGSGSGMSGSTAWNNAVRSRLYLKRVNDDDDASPDRLLTTKKSNYGPAGQTIELTYRDGVFVPVEQPMGVWGAINRRTTETAFLAALDALGTQGRRVNASRNTGTYAPKVMVSMPETDGFKADDLDRAMNRLFSNGVIVMEEDGPQSRRRHFIVRAERQGDQI